MNGNINELIINATKDPHRYEELLSTVITVISKGKASECKLVTEQIKNILKDTKSPPPQKILALELFQTCMLLNKSEFIAEAQKSILQRLVVLAQKNAKTLFKDSNDCLENQQASEQFLNNLLNYFCIWANEFSQAPDKKPSEFTKAFYKLRELVTFPSPKPRESLHKIPTPKNRTASASTTPREKKLNLDYIENVLKVLEKIPNPHTDPSGKELISLLIKIRPEFERNLKNAQLRNNAKETDTLLKLYERISKVNLFGNSNNELTRTRTMNFKEPSTNNISVNHRNSMTPLRDKQFENILEFDACPHDIFQVPHIERNINTSTNSTVTNKPISEMYQPRTINRLNYKPKTFTAITNKEIEEFNQKTENLEKVIAENDFELLNTQQYKLRINELETALDKLKEKLRLKEKECEENHMVKHSSKLISNEDSPLSFHSYSDINMFLSSSSSSQITLQQNILIPNQNGFSPTDLNFRLACCDASSILLNTDIIELYFQGLLDNNCYKIRLSLINKTDALLSDIELDIDNAFGFNIEILPINNRNLQAGEEIYYDLLIKLICFSYNIPKINLEFIYKSQQIKYTTNLPVSICKFSKLIQDSFSELWNEWEYLAFESECTTCKLEFPLNKYEKLIKLSVNSTVINNFCLDKLTKNQYIVVFDLNKKVFVMLTLKNLEKNIEVEVRCESMNIRKAVIGLILKQISYYAS